MSRAVLALDRIVVLLVAIVLIAAGVAAFTWWLGTSILSGPVDAGAVADQTTQPWWPWACGLLGVVLLVLGLRWLAAHVVPRGVDSLRLSGSDAHGKLTARARPVAQAAGDVLEMTPGIRSARGAIATDRGQVVVRITATVEPYAALADVAAAVDSMTGDLRAVLGRDDLHCQARLRVARHAKAPSRVS